MADEFTAEELKEVIRAARVLNPGFSEEQFQSLIELERHIGDPGCLETVRGLRKVEREKGIPLSQALETHDRLLRENEELGQKVIARNTELEGLEGRLRATEERYREVVRAIQDAAKQLEELRHERVREEKEFAAFKRKAAREKQNVDKGLERYRHEADVSREEITGAGELKKQLASRGFSIKFTLDLCQEFVGHENAREKLAKALEERQTLTNYIAALSEQGKAQKEALESELNKLKSEKDGRQAKIKSLEQARNQLENIIGQLQADVGYEEKLRRFFYHYYGLSELLERLASWEQIFFLRCSNPLYKVTGAFDRRAGGAHVWTDKVGPKCPHCGLNTLVYDEGLYQALNWPVGEPLKLQLGQ